MITKEKFLSVNKSTFVNEITHNYVLPEGTLKTKKLKQIEDDNEFISHPKTTGQLASKELLSTIKPNTRSLPLDTKPLPDFRIRKISYK